MGRYIDADELLKQPIDTAHYPSDFVKYVPMAEVILKDQYEARLKSDMVAMLTEIQTEIEELDTHDVERFHGLIENAYISEEVDNIIQQKIDKLKESRDDKSRSN